MRDDVWSGCRTCGQEVIIADDFYLDSNGRYTHVGDCPVRGFSTYTIHAPEVDEPKRAPVKIKFHKRAFCRENPVYGIQHDRCSGVSEPTKVDGHWFVCSCECHNGSN